MHICLEREFPQTDISPLVQSLTCYQLSLLMHPLKVFPQTDSRVPTDRQFYWFILSDFLQTYNFDAPT